MAVNGRIEITAANDPHERNKAVHALVHIYANGAVYDIAAGQMDQVCYRIRPVP